METKKPDFRLMTINEIISKNRNCEVCISLLTRLTPLYEEINYGIVKGEEFIEITDLIDGDYDALSEADYRFEIFGNVTKIYLT